MEMMTCPQCHTTLSVTVAEGAPQRVTRASHQLLDDDRATAVRALVEGLSGRFTTGQLRAMYDDRRAEAGWPELSDKALGRALKVVGATPWRTGRQRGWTV